MNVSLPNGRVCLSRRSDELQRGGGEFRESNLGTRIFAGLTFRTETFSIFPSPAWKTRRSAAFLIRAGINQLFQGLLLKIKFGNKFGIKEE